MYEDSIMHLSENFIRKVLEVQENFLKRPDDVAMMVYSLSDALQKLGVDIMKTFFESIDQCQNSKPLNPRVELFPGNLQETRQNSKPPYPRVELFPGYL